ncbi:hypothetical protein MMC34_002072 [Xylographa carneopallida]|nr:hypothetical protein [Xylographa carneopallida]
MDTPAPTLLSTTTLLSLFSTLLLLLTAYLASHHLLPRPTPRNLRVFYIWHLFSGLTHLTLEASFLYNCFFTYAPLLLPSSSSQHTITPLTGSHLSSAPLVGPFLARPDRAYGSAYGSNPTAKLWQEYARADRRWAGADLTLVSLELLTVGLAGPLALCVAEGLRRGAAARRGVGWEVWFWGTVLATGELYGG